MTSEAEKLASHLSLLRAEYVKLQQKCSRLERELAVASAQAGNTQEDSFVCRLLSLVACHALLSRRESQLRGVDRVEAILTGLAVGGEEVLASGVLGGLRVD